ncbi:MAG: response regulator [Thermoanaerobacteraceae bacterium]|nr:response regulator [Thermoanaerobacteraceae bacterium]
MIIEDNAANAKLVRNVLELEGYATLVARTAWYGISLAKERKPDLIIMDIGLPEIDGFTAAEILKADHDTANIRILALTAYAMEGDAEKCIAAGCDAYLSKPVSINGFLTAVKQFLGP